jgi:hypothetical protein
VKIELGLFVVLTRAVVAIHGRQDRAPGKQISQSTGKRDPVLVGESDVNENDVWPKTVMHHLLGFDGRIRATHVMPVGPEHDRKTVGPIAIVVNDEDGNRSRHGERAIAPEEESGRVYKHVVIA